MAKANSGDTDGVGNDWYKLTPDKTGSYINGTWSKIASMHNTRNFFSSQVLRDGRVYVAGGEYGNGGAGGEIYDPLSNSWTLTPSLISDTVFSDANSEMLPDGRILQAYVSGGFSYGRGNYIFDPVSNTYSPGPGCFASHNESAWVKLKDSSILFIDYYGTSSERYIPSLNIWVKDGTVPVNLYDVGGEMGAGFLLPDGRAFFLGASGKTAYYTPSGNKNPGIWTPGPIMPNGQGAPDAPAAMMVNGKILFATCPIATNPSKEFDSTNNNTSFYEFDYTTNTYTKLHTPLGTDTMHGYVFRSTMLDLPDGNVLYSQLGMNQYFVYTPAGMPLIVGQPTINSVTKINCDTFFVTGTLFNGISEGAAYGDDWQMATNYPIVRLMAADSTVYYARTYNWNRTGIATDTLYDTSFFTLPMGLPTGKYSLVVSANGNPSKTVSFSTCHVGVDDIELVKGANLLAYPNPASKQVTITFFTDDVFSYELKLIDMYGRAVYSSDGNAIAGKNANEVQLDGIAKGLYTVILRQVNNVSYAKLVID